MSTVLTLMILQELLNFSICYPTRQKRLRQWVLAPASLAIIVCIVVKGPAHMTGIPVYIYANNITYWLWATIQMAFMEQDFPDCWRRMKDEKRVGSKESKNPSSFPFWKKVEWALDLRLNVRRIGWTTEPKTLAPRSTSSRWEFVISNLFLALVDFILVDISNTYVSGNYYFDSRLHQATDGPETYLSSKNIFMRIPDILIIGFAGASAIKLPSEIAASLFVGLGISEPSDWPPMFGSFLEAYTLRQFWGRTWHHTMQPLVLGVGKYTAIIVFRSKPRTLLSSCILVCTAFFMTATMHAVGDFMLGGRVYLAALWFFTIQGVGIIFEGLVIQVMKRFISPSDVDRRPWKIVGYIWVLLWFCWTAPIWLGVESIIGVCRTERGIVSAMVIDVWKRYQ